MTERPGREELELDLGRVPTVEEGYKRAHEDKWAILNFVKEQIGGGATQGETPLFRDSLPFMSFANRSQSLHEGIVTAVRDQNPHVAFTLLRAYLELVVLVHYLHDHPEYVEALERPMTELPRNTRKRFSELVDHAAREMRGVVRVYEVLNEMAHFGSTALWAPFRVGGDDDRSFSYGTAPHWKDPDKHPRVALAMLQEADETFLIVIERWASVVLEPQVNRYRGRVRIQAAMARVGVESTDPSEGIGVIPAAVAERAVKDGLLGWCAEHDAWELAEDVTPERVEEWVTSQGPLLDGPD